MANTNDTQIQQCVMTGSTYHVEKPCEGSNATVTLASDAPTYFDFGLQDIIGMKMLDNGALLISFVTGETLTIENYSAAMANSQYQDIQLKDGEVINLQKLAQGLSPDADISQMANADVQTLAGIEPAAGDVAMASVIAKSTGDGQNTYTMIVGETYVADFARTDVQSAAVDANGNLVITFTDNTKTVIENYADIKDATDIPQLTLVDGTVINVTELIASTVVIEEEDGDVVVQTEEIPLFELAQINPEDLASIEPAAGNTAAPVGALGNTGANFGSSVSDIGLSGLDAVGPIGVTALQFGLPEVEDDRPFIESAAAPSTPVTPPSFDVSPVQGYEDNAINFEIVAAPGQADQYIQVVVGGIPAGWTPSTTDATTAAGLYNPTAGTWTITLPVGQSLNSGPVFTPPLNSDADINPLTVTVNQFNSSNVATGSSSGTASVVVDAVADPINLSADDVTGLEDNPVALDIQAALQDLDGSEEITSIVISNVPDGFTLNNGVNLGGGQWAVNAADLSTLTLSAPADYSGTVNLTVTVINEEVNLSDTEFDFTNNDNTTVVDFDVTFNPLADAATLVVNNPIVKEDGSINLNISATLEDPSEYLVVTVSNIDSTWGVATGTNNGTYNAATGTWTITMPAGQNYNGSLTFTPPADSDVDMTDIFVEAKSVESDGSSTNVSTFVDIIVDAVADAPTLDADDISGQSGLSYALDITNGVTDLDGSETLGNVTISGLPTGFSLSAGTEVSAGVWEVTQAQLAGLELNTPAGFDGDFTLNVSVTVTDNPTDNEVDLSDNMLTVNDTVNVSLSIANANPPSVTVAGTNQVLEDGTVFVPFSAALSANALPSEVLTVTLTGIDSTWTVSTGANNGTYNAATGTWTITLPAGQNYNGGLTFTPPANSDVDMTNLSITATATQPENGSTQSANAITTIVVDAVADTPNIDGTNVTGVAGSSIPLTITNSLTDTDGSETLGNVTISGLPAGYSLSAGTQVSPGVWNVTQAQLVGLQLNTPANGIGTFNLTVSVTATEGVTDTDFNLTNNTASASDTIVVTIDNSATPPSVNIAGSHQVFEDGTVFVPFSASLNGGDNSEVLTVTLTGINPAWTISTGASNGTYNAATGTWTITMPAGQNYNGGLTFTPPANSDVDMTGLTLTATSSQSGNNSTESTSANSQIIVDAVADMPTLTVNNTNGLEGQQIALNIAASLTDLDGSEVLSVITISGVPSGFSLTAGTQTSPGVWSVTQAQLSGLKLNTPNNFSGNVPLTVSVTSTEQVTDTDFNLNNNVATNTKTLNVVISDTANPPSLDVDGTHRVLEDGSVFVPFAASITGDNSEILTVEVSGIPSTWTITTGANNGTYNATTGIWTITMPAGQDYTGGLTFAPPADSDIDLNGLVVKATSFAPTTNTTSSVAEIVQIIVDAVADAPIINAGVDGNVVAGAQYALNVSNSLRDTDGSETLGNVTISGVPSGYSLSAGTQVSPGVWSVTQAQLTGLQLNTPTNGSGNVTLTMSVTSTEAVTDRDYITTNNTATSTDVVVIAVQPDAVPIITPPAAVTSREVDLNTPNIISGTISANFGADGPGTYCIPIGAGNFTATGAMSNNTLTSGGQPVTVIVNAAGNTYIGSVNGATIFTLQVNANGNYTFNQFGPLDHASPTNPNEIINLNFQICAKDADGDMAVTTLTVRVQDTGPLAKNDAVTLWSCDFITLGNVITNYNQDGNGRDTLSVEGPTKVVSVTSNGQTYSFVQGGAGAMVVAGKFGDLYIFSDGTYSYVTAQSNPKASHSETFSYSIADADGDISTANLNINVVEVTQTQSDIIEYIDSGDYNTTVGGKAAYQTSNTDGAIISGDTGSQNEIILGNSGNDAIYGWKGNDTLYGGAGNDVLMGEQDNNTLFGGTGSDIFSIHSDKAGNNSKFDTIMDFNLDEGDVLSLVDVIDGFGSGDDINDFVRITLSGNDAVVQVNTDGAGSDFYTVAKIKASAGWDNSEILDVNNLFEKGYIDVY